VASSFSGAFCETIFVLINLICELRLLIFFFSARDPIQSLARDRQALYHWTTSPALWYFWLVNLTTHERFSGNDALAPVTLFLELSHSFDHGNLRIFFSGNSFGIGIFWPQLWRMADGKPRKSYLRPEWLLTKVHKGVFSGNPYWASFLCDMWTFLLLKDIRGSFFLTDGIQSPKQEDLGAFPSLTRDRPYDSELRDPWGTKAQAFDYLHLDHKF
jgi:hypothetical protein